MRNIFYTILLIFCLGCTNNKDFIKGKKQLENQGYNKTIHNQYLLYQCDDKDNYSSGFTALDKKGNKVEGCICSGVLKGVTIRFK